MRIQQNEFSKSLSVNFYYCYFLHTNFIVRIRAQISVFTFEIISNNYLLKIDIDF